jgi:plastocyanin
MESTPIAGPPISREEQPPVSRAGWFLGIVAAAFLGACGGDWSGGQTLPTAADPTTPPPGPNTVAIHDGAFNPDVRTVSVGATVTWVNGGSLAHNSVSDTGAWTISHIPPGGEAGRTFPAAGTYRYRCTLHPGMTGTIVVQ